MADRGKKEGRREVQKFEYFENASFLVKENPFFMNI